MFWVNRYHDGYGLAWDSKGQAEQSAVFNRNRQALETAVPLYRRPAPLTEQAKPVKTGWDGLKDGDECWIRCEVKDAEKHTVRLPDGSDFNSMWYVHPDNIAAAPVPPAPARAVSCVNALAGLSPDAVRGLVEAVRGFTTTLKDIVENPLQNEDPHATLAGHLDLLESALAALEGREG